MRTTWSKEAPAALRISPMFWKTRRVCAAMSPSTSCPVAGIDRDLARDEQQRAGADRLGVRADAFGADGGRDPACRTARRP